MGGIQSDMEDIPPLEPSEHSFALFFQQQNKIKIIHANSDTIEIIRSACLSVSPDCIRECYLVDDGSYRIKLEGDPFSAGSSFDAALLGKKVAMNILANLYAAGWDFLLSSDLSYYENLSTWFFQRTTTNTPPREIPSMFCLSLSSSDCLHLIGRNDDDGANASSMMNDILRCAVEKSYSYGIQGEQAVGLMYLITLNGNPWTTSSVEKGIAARKMLLEIIRQFHARSYRLYATANLKGTADCLFFTCRHQPHQPPRVDTTTTREKFCMISLNGNDQLHLIDCPSVLVDATRQLIADRGSWPGGLQNETDLGRSGGGGVAADEDQLWEFQMRGSPWWANDCDEVYSRLFLTDLFEALLQLGWCVHASLDVSRNLSDISVFVLRSCQPARLPHFCISLNGTDKLRLINGTITGQLREHDTTARMKNILRRAISACWPPQIEGEHAYYDSYEFKLDGKPWSAAYSTEKCLVRAMMCRILAELSANRCRVICSADVSTKFFRTKNTCGRVDVHSWFVVRNTTTTTTSSPPAVAPPFDEPDDDAEAEGPEASAPPMSPQFDYDEPPPSYEDVMK